MSHPYLIKKCDKLCYQILLLRDFVCQRCGSTKNLVPSHCYGKKAWPTLRHIIDNQLLLCNGRHKWWHGHIMDAGDWFDKTWPDRANHLFSAHKQQVKLNKIHFQDTAKVLQTELKRLESDWGKI